MDAVRLRRRVHQDDGLPQSAKLSRRVFRNAIPSKVSFVRFVRSEFFRSDMLTPKQFFSAAVTFSVSGVTPEGNFSSAKIMSDPLPGSAFLASVLAELKFEELEKEAAPARYLSTTRQ